MYSVAWIEAKYYISYDTNKQYRVIPNLSHPCQAVDIKKSAQATEE